MNAVSALGAPAALKAGTSGASPKIQASCLHHVGNLRLSKFIPDEFVT
ncbi:hypothetical protein [Thalassolituus sp.]